MAGALRFAESAILVFALGANGGIFRANINERLHNTWKVLRRVPEIKEQHKVPDCKLCRVGEICAAGNDENVDDMVRAYE
jgi:hypothetical protein